MMILKTIIAGRGYQLFFEKDMKIRSSAKFTIDA